MITLRKAEDRGHANHGWLDTWHSFSFADYYDPAHMGFGALRVINDDVIAPGQGFGTHGHRDMEIVTYMLEGALQHKDSMGNGSVIRPGEVQRMSAGTGVMHSEFNASASEAAHLLQIWILPRERNLAPGYEQKRFPDEDKRGRLRLVASPDGRDGSVTLHQDAGIYAALIAPGGQLTHDLAPGRLAYLHVARGRVRLNGLAMTGGDGARVEDESRLTLDGEGEILLFDLGGQPIS
jgi:hypothetical protein